MLVQGHYPVKTIFPRQIAPVLMNTTKIMYVQSRNGVVKEGKCRDAASTGQVIIQFFCLDGSLKV